MCFTNICRAQNDWEKVSDSLAMVSRTKADVVLKYFDTIKVPKMLYSLEDKYFYLIIKNSPYYEEYYISLDNSDKIKEIHSIKSEKNTKKQRRQQKQYQKLLSEAEPIFDLNKYNTNYITKIPDAEFVRGRSSYFVVKDENGKRYGEFCLPSFTLPVPLDGKLYGYLVRRLSDEIEKVIK